MHRGDAPGFIPAPFKGFLGRTEKKPPAGMMIALAGKASGGDGEFFSPMDSASKNPAGKLLAHRKMVGVFFLKNNPENKLRY